MARYLYILVVVVVMALESVAHAARGGSACVEPTQALPTEQRRDLETSVSAQAKGIADADASAARSAADSFATVLLDKDQLERAWTLYFWCVQKEKKLIDEDFYKEMARAAQKYEAPQQQLVAVAAVAPLSTVSATPAASPSQTSGTSLAGMWLVTMTPGSVETCKSDEAAATYTYTWMVSEDAQGAVNATAELGGSKTSYPNPSGSRTGNRARLVALSERTQVSVGGALTAVLSTNVSTWDLTLDGNTFSGVRRLMTARKLDDEGGYVTMYPCYAEYHVQGRRM